MLAFYLWVVVLSLNEITEIIKWNNIFIFYIQQFHSNTFYVSDTMPGSKSKNKNPCFHFTDYLLFELDINHTTT